MRESLRDPVTHRDQRRSGQVHLDHQKGTGGMPDRRFVRYGRPAYLFLAVLLTSLLAACRGSSPTVEPFAPPYLRLRLCEGQAQLQHPGSADWAAMEGEIVIESQVRVMADAVEGARLCLSDGSLLDLAPATAALLRNPRVFPRLQVVLEEGGLLFSAQAPSYEFTLSVCPVAFLSVPTRIRIEVSGETTHLMVEEGAVNCTRDTEVLTIFACWELYTESDEEVRITEFCSARATATASAIVPTATNTFTPFPTFTPTPTRAVVVSTPTPSPLPPTDTPPSPPPPPRPTSTPTPRPTDTPHPTDTPTPKPTDTPRPTLPPTTESTSAIH